MIGRAGMVARVDRCAGLIDGTLVVLRDDAGLLSTLVGCAEPVASWRCRLMGDVAGTAYVPDACLTPVGSMNSDQISKLIRDQATKEADALVVRIGQILAREGLAEVSDESLALAAEEAAVRHALEQVATASALCDAGFRPERPGGGPLRRDLCWQGCTLRVAAVPTPFGTWWLASAVAAPGADRHDDVMLPGEAPRGEVLAAVLRIWRAACPPAPLPWGLEPGQVYIRHGDVLRAAGVQPARRCQARPAASND